MLSTRRYPLELKPGPMIPPARLCWPEAGCGLVMMRIPKKRIIMIEALRRWVVDSIAASVFVNIG